jgi:capsular exopolysaccharide synthesis family protein
MALAVVVGPVVGAVYYARATPVYQSSAQVLVVNKTPEALQLAAGESRPAYAEDYLSTHTTLIRSPAIVRVAVQNANLGQLPSLAGHGDLTGEIIQSLKVSREMNGSSPTDILNITYRCSRAEDCPVVVKAVIESYQQFLSARYKSVTDETAKLITDASEILEKKLTNKQKEYDRFTLEHPTLWKGKDGISATQDLLLNLESRRSALLLQETEIRGRLNAFEKALRDGSCSRAELVSLISQAPGRLSTEGGTPGATLEERLRALELQERTLLEDYGKDHPQVISVRHQIRLLRSLTGRPDRGAANDESGTADPVKTHVQSLKLELENTRMAMEALGKLVQEEQRKAQSLRSFEQLDESMRTEIARSQLLFGAIAKRLDEVSILKNFAGGYEAETIAPPEVGGKVYPKPLVVFATAIMLGILAGFGLVYAAERSDQSFRNPEEIRRRLGLPVVGHIPFFGPRTDGTAEAAADALPADPILCTVHRPKSREAEAYRGVRTAVLFSNRDGRTKVIQVTSPEMGDGKTTLVANLAVSIAQSGKKVLILDADFRRPRLHKIFNVSANRGLASVIGGEAELPDMVCPTAVPGLSVLPCGPTPPNPAELLTQPCFPELLALLREEYDFVLVDTPPLLAVTDPCVVVPHTDGVILTVRISKNARPQASRARELLSTLGARVLGVVVNGVGADAKGYGYDGYRYTYSYRYFNYYQSDSYDTPGEEESGGSNGAAGERANRERTPTRAAKRKGFLAWLFNN